MIVVVVCLIKKNDQRFTTTTTKIGNFPEGVVGWVSLLVGWVQNSYFKKRPDQSKLIKLNFWFVVSILKLIILLLIKKLVVMVFLIKHFKFKMKFVIISLSHKESILVTHLDFPRFYFKNIKQKG